MWTKSPSHLSRRIGYAPTAGFRRQRLLHANGPPTSLNARGRSRDDCDRSSPLDCRTAAEHDAIVVDRPQAELNLGRGEVGEPAADHVVAYERRGARLLLTHGNQPTAHCSGE